MAKDNNETEKSIRLDDLAFVVLKHHKSMIGFALIGLMVGVLVSFALYVKGLTTVEYYVTASIAVTSTNENGMFSADSYNPNAVDIHLAEDMTDAVIYVCKSDTTLNAAAEKLELIGVSAGDIKPRLMLSQYQKTQIIEMTLVWDNAEEGMLILNAITDVVPDILIQTLKLGDVNIVNPPKVQTRSLSFINVKIVAICMLAGAFLACAYHLLIFFLHPTYLHSEDVVDAYDLEILGEIPKDKNYFATKINSVAANDFYSVQEYFSALAHALVHRLQDVDHACIYITSSAAKEGKSSITANLAYVLSKLGYKILLMDMDVRNPSLSSKFIMDKSEMHSLNAVIRGDVAIHEALVSLNENLDILPTRIEDEPIRLNYKVVEIISTAKQYYDFVILDTAPVGQVSDSMSLNQAADCSLFVIRQDQVWINTVTDSINRLRKSGIEILGIIMNDTRGGSSNYYYYNVKQFGDSPYVHMPNNRKSKSLSGSAKKLIGKSSESKKKSVSKGIEGMIADKESSVGELLASSFEMRQGVDVNDRMDNGYYSNKHPDITPEEMRKLEETPVDEPKPLMSSNNADEVPVAEVENMSEAEAAENAEAKIEVVTEAESEQTDKSDSEE